MSNFHNENGKPSVLIIRVDRHPSIVLAPGTTIWGRSEGCDIRLEDAAVSGRHFRLFFELDSGQWRVDDLGSKNKTRLDGLIIDKPATLPTQGCIEIAGLRLEFHLSFDTDQQPTPLPLNLPLQRTVTHPHQGPAAVRPPPQDTLQLKGIAHQVFFLSEAMKQVQQDTLSAARGGGNLLIEGETGTGKEIVARLYHQTATPGGPFVPINMAAIPKELFESELFGHSRGAFSGAIKDHPGLIRSADGGTLFLDEIGSLPVELQAKLLRVLQDGVVPRLGSVQGQSVRLRIVAASNTPYDVLLADGRLRRDLYFRLHTLQVHLPALRTRREEILPLFTSFLRDFAGPDPVPAIAPDARNLLEQHPWPGNVRQLRHLAQGALILCQRPEFKNAINAELLTPLLSPSVDGAASADSLAELKRSRIDVVLRQTGGNITRAAHILGISRPWLSRLVNQSHAHLSRKDHGQDPDL